MKTYILLTNRIHNIPGKITESILINPEHVSWIMPEGEGSRIGLLAGGILNIMEDFPYLSRIFKLPIREKLPTQVKKPIAKKGNRRNPKKQGKKK